MFEHIDTMIVPETPDYLRDFPVVRVFSTKGSFRWWWWLFMFKEDGVRKQIVAFWTAKTYPDIMVNGKHWEPASVVEGTPENFSYMGLSSFWYWDGVEFHHTEPRVSNFNNRRKRGRLEIRSDDIHHIHEPDRFLLRFCRDPNDFDLTVDQLHPATPKMGYNRTLITKKMGFDSLQLFNASFSGSLNTQGHDRKIKGSLYMQNVTLNTPSLPWLWGLFHNDDGSYINYFSCLMGPLMLTRKPDLKPWMDNRFKCIKSKLHYTPVGGPTRQFGNLRFRVTRDERGRPSFDLKGSTGKESLSLRVRTLARTTYTFERDKYWHNRFFYNEFPSEIAMLEFTDAEGVVHRQDGSQWAGNSEYSWGLFLN